MKKIVIALALILSVTMVSAQPKNPADAQKAVDKAVANSKDAKKALKPATWISLADAYINAYELPTKNLLINTPQMEVKLFLKGQQVISTETRKGTEGEYTVDIYQDKDLYYNSNGLLELWIVTKPAVEGDLLGLAKDALMKAAAVDAKGAKTKDIAEKLENIHQKLNNEALSLYLIGNYKESSRLFEASLGTYDNDIVKKIDSMNVYYTALVSAMAGDREKAITYYKKCIDMKYYSEGNAFSNLAEIYRTSGDMDACKATLEHGFAQYPQSQGILVGLINLYRETGDDPKKMFDLLHQAQENEPNNASLFYVEGEVYKNLGDIENAAKLFRKSSEVDPNYVFGILNVGILYYDHAVDIQNAANEETDDAKYMAYVKEFEESLEKAIEPFEKAFSVATDPEIKQAIAEYLKNVYFRFREKGPEYAAAYEKYNNYLKVE
ncbi:MAG: hypothetical protein PHD11_04080 [Bacteroidales bacterium]|nr:hypothetical protein [Bacteroidales bacterium]MDD4670244.1 hypothetical protein [Bacteroidales bacterium]